MSHLQLVMLLLCSLPLAAPLQCYTCVFPAISPLDCFKFPQECPAGQRCLSSTATGRRGSLQVSMYEKSCAVPSQCGVSGQKYASGLYFNYTNVCCDTDLCNGAGSVTAVGRGRVALWLLAALVLCCWPDPRGPQPLSAISVEEPRSTFSCWRIVPVEVSTSYRINLRHMISSQQLFCVLALPFP
ncbi:sperm acrosome membrane-associated protein 4-like [Takifugu flavidus]|uniref:sperm acrosome membrane-associated protein 4-like n=1 Tax=Takifugu flavidus TaxID=433684 RepID=UPI0025445057|nr:sperm acrosome membrane-associated protein 4-like [Takifugu flavidus]